MKKLLVENNYKITKLREIATLKVLGLYPLEIDNYIYKETVILEGLFKTFL